MSEQTKHPGDEGQAFPCEGDSYKDRDGTVQREVCPGLTPRQYAAIHLRVPDSGLDWLDAMIDKARRDEFAGKALVGVMDPENHGARNTPCSDQDLALSAEGSAEEAVRVADALLAELAKGGES